MSTVLHDTGFYFNVACQGKSLRAGALAKKEGEIVLRLVTLRKYLHFCLVYARLLQGDRYGNDSSCDGKNLQFAGTRIN